MIAWLRRWLSPRLVYVVCAKGIPVAVCLDKAAVELVLTDRPPRETRVYALPITEATS